MAGVFEEPDPTRIALADVLACPPAPVTIKVGVHCTRGEDRTGYESARAQVMCGGMTPEAAHEQWHQLAQYSPYGSRVPSPGLEAAWGEFVEKWRKDHPSGPSADAGKP